MRGASYSPSVSPEKTMQNTSFNQKGYQMKNTYTPPIIPGVSGSGSGGNSGSNQILESGIVSGDRLKLDDHIREINRRNEDKYDLFSEASGEEEESW